MIRSISSFLCLAIIVMCFITSGGQTTESNKLIDEINVQSWKEKINRIKKENEELRRQISTIESRQGIVLIEE